MQAFCNSTGIRLVSIRMSSRRGVALRANAPTSSSSALWRQMSFRSARIRDGAIGDVAAWNYLHDRTQGLGNAFDAVATRSRP